MDISQQTSNGPLVVGASTKLSQKIPKPFSIESLIATRSCSPNRREPSPNQQLHPHHHHHHHQHSQHSMQQNLYSDNMPPNIFQQNFGLPPNFPLYHPWTTLGYLTHTTNERITQLLNNDGEKLAHFLENSDITRDKMTEMFLNSNSKDPRLFLNAAAAADPASREKLAQYFVNNVRDPKLTEFLLSATTGTSNSLDLRNSNYLSEPNNSERFVVGSGCSGLPPNAAAAFSVMQNSFLDNNSLSKTNSNITNLFVKSDQFEDGDKEIDDIESGAESCSDLSLTMSPDGSNKNAGMC